MLGGQISHQGLCVCKRDNSGSRQQMYVDKHRSAFSPAPSSLLVVWSSFLAYSEPSLSWSEAHKSHVTLCFIAAEACEGCHTEL